MRAPLPVLVAVFGLLGGFGCSAGTPGPGPADGAVSGAVSDGSSGDIVLRVRYPQKAAALIAVRGDRPPLSWDRGLPMQPIGPDLWELRLPGVTGPLRWKPLIDDRTWSRGSNYAAAPNQTAEACPHFVKTTAGKPAVWQVASAILGNTRPVWVYLPPSYDENPACTYPVVYMHDGQNLFDPKTAYGGQTWQVQETLDAGIDALADDQHLPEAIVIGPGNAGAARICEYTPTPGDLCEPGETCGMGLCGGHGDLYLRFLTEELKPQVDRTLRTRPGAASTTLMGSSLGGLISAHAGLVQGGTWGRIGVLSPSTWWDGGYITQAVTARGQKTPRPLRVYVDCGTVDDGQRDTDGLVAAYRGVGYRDGIDLLYVVQQGAAHQELYWAQRLPAALRFLLGD